jgi:hypothetical protein
MMHAYRTEVKDFVLILPALWRLLKKCVRPDYTSTCESRPNYPSRLAPQWDAGYEESTDCQPGSGKGMVQAAARLWFKAQFTSRALSSKSRKMHRWSPFGVQTPRVAAMLRRDSGLHPPLTFRYGWDNRDTWDSRVLSSSSGKKNRIAIYDEAVPPLPLAAATARTARTLLPV